MAVNPPQITRNLTTGSTGTDVKALQEWLKAQGYFPANQATTETYGPITTQAVAAWQAANNIDTKGGSGSYGPISQAFVTKQLQGTDVNKGTTTVNQPVVNNTNTTKTTTTNMDAVNSSLRSLGLSDQQIASIPDSQKPVFAGIGDVMQKQYESGPITSFDVQKAFEEAANTPEIIAKYGDSLKAGIEDFNKTIQSYQTDLTQGMSDKERQFKHDQKTLQEAEAGAGRAYSGFRQQATDNLTLDESSVINSTRSQAQQNLDKLKSDFENKYGSDALKSSFGNNPISLSITNPLTGADMSVNTTALGGITGADQLSKTADIKAKAADLQSLNTIK